MPVFGAHVSIAGGLYKAPLRAKVIGVQALQIFASSPQSFRTTSYGQEDFNKFREEIKIGGLGPVFFHGVYLINLGSESPILYDLSINSLIYYLNLCPKLGVEGVIFHIGSHKGRGYEAVKERIYTAIERVISTTKVGKLILENNAGQGGGVGTKFEEIVDIINHIRSDRLAICLDSQHAFAAGYDVSSKKGLDKILTELDETVGLKNLIVVHLNDSKFPLGSFRDRHENIGEGLIGKEGIARIVNHDKLKDLPFVLEVPGFDGKGPDKKNLDLLKSLVD